MSRRDWGDVVALVFFLALLTLLVRPDSIAPAFLAAAGAALTAIVGFTADPQTTTSGSGASSGGPVVYA
jgi:hypothetical protein